MAASIENNKAYQRNGENIININNGQSMAASAA
jgi:hypothetical protein